jgi:glycosyltransferase involved in cell wall biosynthesis
LTGLSAERFMWLPVHDPDALAEPAPWTAPAPGALRLLFFGTGVPLHGLATLIDAVAAVPAVHLTLIGGTGPDRARAIGALGPRLSLLPTFVARDALQRELAASHLVAGVFGAPGSSKVQRVVPFKLVHALAAGRPVITADTPAVARWLDGSEAVLVAEPGDAVDLAARLLELAAAPARLAAAAAAARPAYDRHFGTDRLATRCHELLLRLTAAPTSEAA